MQGDPYTTCHAQTNTASRPMGRPGTKKLPHEQPSKQAGAARSSYIHKGRGKRVPWRVLHSSAGCRRMHLNIECGEGREGQNGRTGVCSSWMSRIYCI